MKNSTIARLACGLLLVLTLLVVLTAAGCNFNASNTPTVTQVMGDQDVVLGNANVTIAGQAGNYQGHGESVFVYILTINACTSPDVYVPLPSAGKPTQFVLPVNCNGTKYVVLGSTDANGTILSATPIKLKA